MAIKLNKVALKAEKSRCYLVQSATECLPQEIWRNAPWFAPLAFWSSEYQSPYENCSTCTFIKGPIFLFYYDERKERLRYLLLHILFFLEAFAIHLHVIFLQKIISVIIAIYSIASNEEFCITIIQLLQVWIAMVSSWLIVQVNFMTFLGEKITHIYYAQPVKTYSGQTDPLILH